MAANNTQPGSISKAEKERLKAIIGDTITLLCRNGLNAKFQKEFVVEGLIGITVDSDELVLVSIKDTVKNPNAKKDDSEEDSDGENLSGSKKRKRKRHKSGDIDGSSEPKTPRNDGDFDNSMTTPGRRPYHSQDSYDSFSLQEMKQDYDDNDQDLVQIVKQEPGIGQSGFGGNIVSVQQLPGGHGMMPGMSPMMSGHGMPNMPPGGMPPVQMGDLNEQVELMPGSGVYIKRATYNQLQFIDKGSKLVRKLVREIFPDVHLLASSSCMGKGETSAGLDRHKVEVIKGFVHGVLPLYKNQDLIREINKICHAARQKAKGGAEGGKKGGKRGARSASPADTPQDSKLPSPSASRSMSGTATPTGAQQANGADIHSVPARLPRRAKAMTNYSLIENAYEENTDDENGTKMADPNVETGGQDQDPQQQSDTALPPFSSFQASEDQNNGTGNTAMENDVDGDAMTQGPLLPRIKTEK